MRSADTSSLWPEEVYQKYHLPRSIDCTSKRSLFGAFSQHCSTIVLATAAWCISRSDRQDEIPLCYFTSHGRESEQPQSRKGSCLTLHQRRIVRCDIIVSSSERRQVTQEMIWTALSVPFSIKVIFDVEEMRTCHLKYCSILTPVITDGIEPMWGGLHPMLRSHGEEEKAMTLAMGPMAACYASWTR